MKFLCNHDSRALGAALLLTLAAAMPARADVIIVPPSAATAEAPVNQTIGRFRTNPLAVEQPSAALSSRSGAAGRYGRTDPGRDLAGGAGLGSRDWNGKYKARGALSGATGTTELAVADNGVVLK
ncbi:hypothetical protein V8J36_07305 [Frigidibacter sp. MR17.14]|uniref:hypothetical protein n=1 Tax=Frigidibacter sp. MR17.14 TaxID=3126509 RepID=UPI003012E1AD